MPGAQGKLANPISRGIKGTKRSDLRAVMAKNERRLVPIVSLDVEGYSRLIQLDETATLSAVRHVFKDRVEATIGEHGGSVFKTMGDGVLAEFGSVVAAVEWTSQLQQQLYQVPLAARRWQNAAIARRSCHGRRHGAGYATALAKG